MKLGTKVSIDPLALFNADIAAGKKAVKAVMTRATADLKTGLRDMVQRAGLGPKLANAWRGETYPVGRDSMNASTYVWSNAPQIHQAFDAGALIRRSGGLWLALPTENTPRSRGARGATGKATPFEVEDQFNQDLILLPGKHPGVAYLAMRVVQAKNKKGWRKGTDKRLAQGRQVQVIVMFVLVKQVKLPKLTDIDAVVAQVQDQIPADLVTTWDQYGQRV